MNRLILFCLLLLFPFSISAAQSCEPAEGEPIRLGLVFPKESMISARNTDYRRGVEAMIAAFNQCGGVNGRPVEGVYVPANSRDEAEVALDTLAEQNIPLVIGSGMLAVSERLQELAEPKQIVFWQVSESLRDQSEWTFTPRPNNHQLGLQAAQFIENVGNVRAALIYEDSVTGRAIAEGVLDGLSSPPIIEESYEDYLYRPYRLAQQIRDNDVNYVFVVAFDTDSDSLWYQLRDADAQIDGWVHIGDEGYRQNQCQRFGNSEAMISVSPSGSIDENYRHEIEIYSLYRDAYDDDTSEQADLSASGVYLLLRYILPQVQGDYTAENIRAAILASDVPLHSGLMGEGFEVNAEGENARAVSIVQQRQEGAFCSLTAEGTCSNPVQPFMTWRERAIIEERERICHH